ncbi:MAG: hypothetical protein CL963_02400 [Euryarchaeota archaeon]|nr:hypothetical protein [Euryarchaeota archaeon]HIK01443.1 hypothetical protein [Candidatus Undinarchaeales archaeon ERR594346 U_76725]|tara:strand:- start:23727 stop:24560 length:834 start_codon:yes stop_codon:yes gene_type:complete
MAAWMLIGIPIGIVLLLLLIVMAAPGGSVLNNVLFEFREYERAVVFRFGKYHRIAKPGWNFILPIIESFVKYDMRTESIDIPPQQVITKDRIKVLIDAIMYLRVSDPAKAELEVEEDYRKAIEEHLKGRIRNVVGNNHLEDVYGNIDKINSQLKHEIQELTDGWGIEIIEVELISVIPPEAVLEAMEAQQIAQRYKEAAAEEAETTKIRINAIEAAAGKLSEPALNYLYLQTLKEVADGRSSKLIFPMEFTKMAQNLSSGLGGKESGLEKLVEQIKK